MTTVTITFLEDYIVALGAPHISVPLNRKTIKLEILSVLKPHLFVVPGPSPALFGHEVDQGILVLGETLGVHVTALVTLPAVTDDPGHGAPVHDLRTKAADCVLTELFRTRAERGITLDIPLGTQQMFLLALL